MAYISKITPLGSSSTYDISAQTVKITDTTPTSATSYFLTYVTGKTEGNNYPLRANGDLYYYDTGTSSYLNLGSSSHSGGLTLHNANGKYGDIITSAFSDNRTFTLPNASGTIALTSDLSSYVLKAGDTMTGNLTINKADSCLYLKTTNMDTSTTTNSASTYNQIFFVDKNGRLNGFLQGTIGTDAKATLYMGVRTRNSDNSADIQQHFGISMAKDGTASTYFTHSAAWRAGLLTPAMVTEQYPALLPTNGSNNWIKVGTANDSYGLLPSQAGGASSGHNYLGTSSWYWKYAYINEIYGHLNGSITGNAATATQLQTPRSLWGQSFNGTANVNGTIYITPSTGNWSEGIRIKPYSSWATIILGGNDLTADSGTSANSWSIHNNNGSFYITRNGSTTGTAQLACVSNKWSVSGNITSPSTASSWILGQNSTNAAYNVGNATNTDSYWPWMRQTNTSSAKWFSFGTLNTSFYWIGSATSRTANSYDYGMQFNVANGYLQGCSRVYGAVWNDYAEYRKDNPNEIQKPGCCVKELGNGALALTTKRLERGCEIISDTFGFAIGQDEENGYNTPIASNGRVLAYPYESIEEFTTHIGWSVCSGPDGTVSIMTEEEEEKYPSRIIGTISEIPTYEEWGTGKVKVDGRIWIRIR